MKHLFEKELGAFYTKGDNIKKELLNQLIKHKKDRNLIDYVVYFCPKKFQNDVLNILEHDFQLFFYEDVSKTNRPYDLSSERALLILDGASRYKNISTQTFKRLSRISSGYKHKFLIDQVPFTSDIQYLYLPYAYLDRSILGHQHFYAFRENNQEYFNGQLVAGHDFHLLAHKIKYYCYLTYPAFFENHIETIEIELTADEKAGYNTLREELFERFDKFNPIVTRLADYSNTRESTYKELRKLLNKLTGKTILYTNIKSHNKRLKKEFPEFDVYTFYDANGIEKEADNIVLVEVPIVKSYLFLDILARIKPTCNIYFLKPNTSAINLLYKHMTHEFTQINDFTKVLWEVQQGEKVRG